MKLTVREIVDLKISGVSLIEGALEVEGYRPWPPESAPPGAIVFVSTPEQLEMALEAPAGIIFALKKSLRDKVALNPNQALFSVSSVPSIMNQVNRFFDQKNSRWPKEIHSTAVIDPSATIPKSCSIGAYCVIGANVKIGANTRISPHTVIEKNVKIGEDCYLHPQVFIGADSEIGNSVEIHPHTTVGSDGYGYFKPQNERPQKISQLGKVVIGDHVEIGSNCAIDRATLTETRIGSGSKLDNHVHIAHNCKLGKNSFYTAGFMTAGSVEIGDNFSCGGMVGVVDHIKITDNVTIGARSTVTKDIKESGAYLGYPIEPWREGLKTLASIPGISDMKKQINEILKQLGKGRDK